ncbi:MAG: type II toxin-antitoxin system RelE/ParE family toxin [Candidatus Omnitrophica bacterium]|nr:type II toxin-antitoxin system RelE/ParE family toxin [Candidatus Omnitrophota bacterium]
MTRYKIRIVPKVQKQIDSLPDNVKTKVIGVIMDILGNTPYQGKPLKGDYKGRYSYRVSDYRIIYSIFKYELLIRIIKVMYRREAYR